MRTDKSYVSDSVRIIEIDNQPVFVAGNPKNDAIASYCACVAIHGLNILRALPICSLRFLKPGLQGLFGIAVSFPEITERGPFDDPHPDKLTCSQFGDERRIRRYTREIAF